MSFKYDLTANQQTPTSDSKVVLCKSFKIDIAAGSGFLSGTTYDLGWLPKEAQIVSTVLEVITSVSGGTVSVATLVVSSGSGNLVNGTSVFTVGTTAGPSINYYQNGLAQTADQKLTYTPTLTGAGATAGIIYINILYVV